MSHQNEHIDKLLDLCRQGKQSAQLEVYNRYFGAMYNVANRIVKNPAEAEDVMQESFLNAFTKLHTFKGEVAFGYNTAISYKNTTQYFDEVEYNTFIKNDAGFKKV